MATWYDFIISLKTALAADTTLTGIPIKVGRDEPVPKYPAIRIVRGEGAGEQRLRARGVGAKKTQEILIEAWEGSSDPDPLAAYALLEALENKLDTALAAWADSPTGMTTIQFYAHITKRSPANDSITRPAVGSQITVMIEYI